MLSTNISRAQSVGVVMSGGGAKGLYHIGTIEALEESGVPIDYVAGTSMGAIIAALYAAGYSTEEMREITTSGELERWLSGRIDQNLGAYFRRGSTLREDDPMITYRFQPKKNEPDSLRKMARSLISSTQIDMATVELFAPASTQSGGDFSKLMIPMLCVASDITANEGRVITSGDLGQAVRASMAIPIAFKPIVDDEGHILYDGGIYDNFPWRQMKEEFNPDIIIGSVCGVDPYNSTDSWSNTNNLSVIDQVLLLSMTPTNYDIPTEDGVVIKRDVPVGMLDFSSAKEIIDMGYYDTLNNIDSIVSRISPTSLKSEEEYRKRRNDFRERNPELSFDKYNITGINEDHERYLDSFMLTSRRQQRLNNDQSQQREMDFGELRTALYTILSSDDFITDYPTVSYDSERQHYLFEIGMENKPSLKATIGGNISSTPFNQLYAGISYRTIKRVTRELFGEAYLGALYSAGRMGYRADFYRRSPIFFDAYYTFSMKNLLHGNFGQLTTIDNTLDIKQSDQVITIGIGTPIRRRSLMMLQLNAGTDNNNYEYGLPTDISMLNYWGVFYKTRFNYLASRLLLEKNTIDSPSFPTSGSRFSISGIGVLGEESSYSEDLTTIDDPHNDIINILRDTRSWYGAKAQYTGYLSPMRDNLLTLGLSLEGVYTTIPEMYTPTFRQLLMPSYSPIVHSNMIYMPEFSAPRYAAAGASAKIKLWQELYLKGEFYAMIRDKYDETMRITEGDGFSMHYITQGSLLYKTPIGLMSLSLTKYNLSGWDNLYLTFNFGYPIFAPKGTFY